MWMFLVVLCFTQSLSTAANALTSDYCDDIAPKGANNSFALCKNCTDAGCGWCSNGYVSFCFEDILNYEYICDYTTYTGSGVCDHDWSDAIDDAVLLAILLSVFVPFVFTCCILVLVKEIRHDISTWCKSHCCQLKCCFGKKSLEVDLISNSHTPCPMTLDELIECGTSSTTLRKAGFTAIQLREKGLSVEDIIIAEYSPKELLDAGIATSGAIEVNDMENYPDTRKCVL